MVDTLHQVLSPLFIMCFVMGLSFYPRKQLNIPFCQIVNLNILYPLIKWVIYSYSLLYMLTHFTRKILFDSAAMEIITEINYLLSIVSAIISFCYQKRFEISIKKLAAVDDTLEKLGTPKTYEKLHIKLKLLIISWIMYSISMNIFDAIWWLRVKEIASWAFFIAYVENHCIQMNTFVDILFIFFLWYIGTRFDRVNDHIRYLLAENHNRYTPKKSTVAPHRYILSNDYVQILWTTMHLHLELTRLTRELNLIFTVQMTSEMTSYLPYLSSLSYHVYIMLMKEHRNELYTIYDWFSIGIWIFIFFMRIYIVNYICESISVKAKEINKIIHQLTNIYRYSDVRKEIYQFTLQTMYHPLKITGMGFFNFGYEFLRKFYMAILMYVIIMAQFKIPTNY